MSTPDIHDYVGFILPWDREWQFPAMTIVQTFVQTYDERMNAAQPYPGSPGYVLHYGLEMNPADLAWWRSVGFKLKTEPEEFDRCDMEIDLTEDRIMPFMAYGRHICQVMGALCGVAVNPVPEIRQVKPALTRNVLWADRPSAHPRARLQDARDGEWSVVVGHQSWLTWWAVAMGLPTIEIMEPRRNPTWMSKWAASTYRQIEEGHLEFLDRAIDELGEVTALIAKNAQRTPQAVSEPLEVS